MAPRQLVLRKGKTRVAVAVARSIIVIAYHVIKEQRPYTVWGQITSIAVAAMHCLVAQLRARRYTVSRWAA